MPLRKTIDLAYSKRQDSNFLSLPLEIREHIYSYVFPDLTGPCKTLSLHRPRRIHNCSYEIMLCSRQIYHETRGFISRRGVFFSTAPDSGNIGANVPCLHILRSLPALALRFEINPFQNVSTIPMVYRGLLSICQSIRRTPGIQLITIVLDGSLPRSKPPQFINEIDIDRAPLHIILLLYPFTLLHGVNAADIVITGGPLNDRWMQYCALEQFKCQVVKRMQALSVPPVESVITISKLLHQLPGGLLWNNEACRSLVSMGLRNRPGLSGITYVGEHESARATCSICHDKFKSRNMLFHHLKSFHGIYSSGRIEQRRRQRKLDRLSSLGII
jgi:hypothetical protein